MKCKKCGIEFEDWEPHQNDMCIDCFAAEWAEMVEISPLVCPEILGMGKGIKANGYKA